MEVRDGTGMEWNVTGMVYPREEMQFGARPVELG